MLQGRVTSEPMKTPAPAARTPRWLPIRFVLIGALAAGACAVLDALLLHRVLPGSPPRWSTRTLAYAGCIAIPAGVVIGCCVAIVNAIASRLGRGGTKPARAALPWAIVGGALLIWWNQDLFDGPWIKMQSWVGLAKAVFMGLMPVCAGIAAWLLIRIANGSTALRLGGAMVLAAAALVVDYLNGTALLAYARIHEQMSLAVVGLLIAASDGLVGRIVGRYPRVGLIVALALVAVCLGLGTYLRGQNTIYRVRGAIRSGPYPAVSRVMSRVEEPIFDRLRRIKEFDAGSSIDLTKWKAPDVTGEVATMRRDGGAKNVLWIAIDAIRADHLGAMGYNRPITPRLDAFIAKSVLFERAYTPAPASMFAYSSILSGMLARASVGYSAENNAGYPVPDDFSLASQLKSHGFVTAGFMAFHQATLKSTPGFGTFAAGFDFWNQGRSPDEIAGDKVTDIGISLIDNLRKTKAPYFAFIHYMDPHAPYRIHDQFDYGRRPQDGYDSEIAFADREVGRLLDHVEATGGLSDTIIVLFGDHGESFGEHNAREHGGSLHDHEARIPLIVACPGIQPRRVKEAVSLGDLMPTMLQLLGLKDKYERLGRDLTPLMLGRTDGWFDYAYAERPCRITRWPGSFERMVVRNDLKMIWDPVGGTYRVYDLARDPAETADVFDAGNAKHQELRALLAEMDKRIDGYWKTSTASRPAPQASVTDSLQSQLDALAAATDDSKRVAVLAQMSSLLHGDDGCFRGERTFAIGEAKMKEFEQRLVELAQRVDITGPVARPLVTLLALFKDPELAPLFKRFGTSSAGDVRLISGLGLADLGDDGLRNILDFEQDNADFRLRLRIRAALAKLGDEDARAWLRPHLSADTSPILAVTLRGLAGTKDPEICERYLARMQHHWREAVVDRAMVDVCAAGTTPWHDLALYTVAGSADDTARVGAERLLARRGITTLPDRDRNRAEIFSTVAQSSLGWDWPLALKYLSDWKLYDEAARLPEALWRVRLAWETHDAPTLNGAIADARSLGKHLSPMGDSMLSKLQASFAKTAFTENRLAISAEILDAPFTPHMTKDSLVMTKVRVRNTTKAYLFGGSFTSNVRVTWFFADGTGQIKTPGLVCEVFLPREGLAPDETAELVVPARIPRMPGVMTPTLVAGVVAQYVESAHVLLKAAPITVD